MYTEICIMDNSAKSMKALKDCPTSTMLLNKEYNMIAFIVNDLVVYFDPTTNSPFVLPLSSVSTKANWFVAPAGMEIKIRSLLD